MQWVSSQTLNQDLTDMKIGLRFAIAGAKRMGADDRAEPGLLRLFVDHEAQSVNMYWVNAEDIPFTEGALKTMASTCRPGDPTRITILIEHPDGSKSGYLISPMVPRATFTSGYVVLAEIHYPAGHGQIDRPHPEPQDPADLFENL